MKVNPQRNIRFWLVHFCFVLVVLTQAAFAVVEANPLVEVSRELFFLVRGQPGTVRVLQVVHVFNAGSSPSESVSLALPEGARLMEPPEGWGSVEPVSGGLRDGQPLHAGESREYRVLYELTLGSRPLALRRSLPYPVEEIIFWAEADAVTISGLQLENLGEEELGGELFRVYAMRRIGPHESWQVVARSISGSGGSDGDTLPDLSHQRHGDPLRMWAELIERLAWVFPLALIGIGGTVIWRRWGRGQAAVDEATRTRQALQDEIVKIDVAYRAGELDDDVYRPRRQQLMQRLVALWPDPPKERN